MNDLVRLHQVSKTFAGRPVLRQVNLTIRPREHHWITGPSGCGKSTLLRLIAGLETPDAGEVHIADQVASDAGRIRIPPHRRGLSMMFQDLGLWPNLTVRGNVLLGLSGTGRPQSERDAWAHSAWEACEVGHLLDRRPAELSGGEQQRAALARALAPRPGLLLLDEPFAGLDLLLRRTLIDRLLDLAARFETTLCLVSHDPMDAERLHATVSVLEDGAICETGPLQTLLADPRSQTLRAWQNAANRDA